MTETLNCPICGGDYEYDPQNRGDHRRNKCATCRRKEKRNRRMAELMEYAGGQCEECGYDKCWRALDFHHTNPEDKVIEINKRTIDRSWDLLYEEVDKCELLCANCHRERHCDGCDGCMVQ